MHLEYIFGIENFYMCFEKSTMIRDQGELFFIYDNIDFDDIKALRIYRFF